MNIVWFKRDLRIDDHQALSQAAQHGVVMPLYILEPELWQQLDMSQRHYRFMRQSLLELNTALSTLGQPLIIKVGDAVEVFKALHARYRIDAIWSHQETWNGWTYRRDVRVRQWADANRIDWYEPVQNGVIRRLRHRDGWAARWHQYMQQPLVQAPHRLERIAAQSDALPNPLELGLQHEDCDGIQAGGRQQALQLLHGFLYQRGQGYAKQMSSPLTAFTSCSRLSAHLAFGTISMREVFQACQQRRAAIKRQPAVLRGQWPMALNSYAKRLRWHCHFMQKLEDEPSIEFDHLHPAYDGLREADFNDDYFRAWRDGKTGYPIIDACMRALIATGWINFRMRAMLMSFASYHLWLHWRRPALHLARLFTDYEPGIHYSQVQMQSGTTGINAIRVYNPIKQGLDQDPDGVFVRQWIPQLRQVDRAFIHTPWVVATQMADYPLPIVDERVARKAATAKIYQCRQTASGHREIAAMIVNKHASRKAAATRKRTKKTINNDRQGELPL